MDRVSINAVEDLTHMGLDRDAAAMLVVQSDESSSSAAEEIGGALAQCELSGASEVFATDDAQTGEAFVSARRMAIPAVERKGSLLLEDVGVPLPELGALVRGIAAISAARDVTIAVIAHAGDGNTHPLLVHDPADPDETERAQRAYGQIMDLAISLGGTITGEHGVGRLKKAWLADYLGEAPFDLNRLIKHALDPQGILGRGVMF